MTEESTANSGLSLKEWVARLDGKLDAFAQTKVDKAELQQVVEIVGTKAPRDELQRLQTQTNELEHHVNKLNAHLQETLVAAAYRAKMWKIIGSLVGGAASLSLIAYYLYPLHH